MKEFYVFQTLSKKPQITANGTLLHKYTQLLNHICVISIGSLIFFFRICDEQFYVIFSSFSFIKNANG